MCNRFCYALCNPPTKSFLVGNSIRCRPLPPRLQQLMQLPFAKQTLKWFGSFGTSLQSFPLGGVGFGPPNGNGCGGGLKWNTCCVNFGPPCVMFWGLPKYNVTSSTSYFTWLLLDSTSKNLRVASTPGDLVKDAIIVRTNNRRDILASPPKFAIARGMYWHNVCMIWKQRQIPTTGLSTEP